MMHAMLTHVAERHRRAGGVLGVHHRHGLAELDFGQATRDYFRSTKMKSQSVGPMFSAECEAVTGTGVAVPALLVISTVLPSAA